MVWITRAHVKVDRVACPCPFKRFVDSESIFHFAPAEIALEEAERFGAIYYDMENVERVHHGSECSFDAVINKFTLATGPALVLLGKIIRGADTDNALWHHLEAAGLQAIAEGFRHPGLQNDHAIIAAERIVYDSLSAYSQGMIRRGKQNGAFQN
jgi:hypothetical protein